jgi:hypothetical protein
LISRTQEGIQNQWTYHRPKVSNVLINWIKVNKLQANPDKFHVLAVGKKTFDKNMKICIQISTLSCEETVKLLGIEIDYQLNFDKSIVIRINI